MSFRSLVLVSSTIGVVVLLGTASCSEPQQVGVTNYGTGGSGGGNGSTIVLPEAGAIPTGGSGGNEGNGQPEICNGIDDNENGIVDDLDVDGDGVCDCIRIATLGKPGTWGEGDVFGSWLTARATDGAKDLSTEVITPELIQGFQVIVVQDVREKVLGRVFSEDEVAALDAWVRGGGGLMTLIGYDEPSEVENVNRLLAPFGMGYGSRQILKAGGARTMAVTNFTSHPITANIQSIGVNDGYEPQGDGTAYSTSGNYQVGLAQEVDKGRVDMWGDEWITYNSEWTQHPDYQVELFWVNTIKWLTPENICQVPVPPYLIP